MSTRRTDSAATRASNRIHAQRTTGLPPRIAALLREAEQLLNQGDLRRAELALTTAAITAPEHPETLRWSGTLEFKRGRFQHARDEFLRALAHRPEDAVVLCLLASVQAELGEDTNALNLLRKAAECADDGMAWLSVGMELDRQGYADDALAAANRALEFNADDAVARLLRARCMYALGNAEGAAADYRVLIARKSNTAAAWYAMLDQKTIRIDAQELIALERAEAAAPATGDDRALLAFALGKAYEDAGQYDKAFAALTRANAYARAERPWNPAAFSTQVDAVRDAFDGLTTRADVVDQGGEVIFVVGLPRSGTTLVEQVLAAHPQVEGASELPYLYRVVGEESHRREQPFPQWVSAATSGDWGRMGRRYLQLSARWRTQRPRATDKLPANWLLAGAAMAMLPAARVIGCRRDAIETCWSCYKQLFAKDLVGFAYDFDSLAAYWHDCDRLCRYWAGREPERFRIQQYEDFVADPEGQVRALLAFCGLEFDAACLRFHEAQRSVRTASAAQVRQPLRQDTARSARYGELLAPLRSLLSKPASQ